MFTHHFSEADSYHCQQDIFFHVYVSWQTTNGTGVNSEMNSFMFYVVY